ncbi:MAG: hypothetical protein IJN28_01690 [Selenomonadales bacterium]|nr:hypothetical protein [Selenomonadales bacterium]
MVRHIFLFIVAMAVGLGAADYQVRDMRDGIAEVRVYGWQVHDKAIDIVWMGDVYPAVSWNHDGDLIMEAGGLDYNLTDGRDGVVRAIEDGYEKGADFMQSMWDVW